MSVLKFIILTLIAAHYSSSIEIILPKGISQLSPVTLSCNISNLKSNDSIKWEYTNPNETVTTLGRGSVNISLTKLTDVGEYVCKYNGSSTASFSAVFLGTPEIQNTRKSVTFNEGDKDRKLTCLSKGSYPPAKFEWTREGEKDRKSSMVLPAGNDNNINITETAESSVLLFHNLTYSMQAYYVCTVSNVAGRKTAEVLVRVKDRFAALWPFLGIVAEVIILIIIIFLYEKQSKKAAQVTADTEKDESEKPLQSNSESKVDGSIRNRSPNNNNK